MPGMVNHSIGAISPARESRLTVLTIRSHQHNWAKRRSRTHSPTFTSGLPWSLRLFIPGQLIDCKTNIRSVVHSRGQRAKIWVCHSLSDDSIRTHRFPSDIRVVIETNLRRPLRRIGHLRFVFQWSHWRYCVSALKHFSALRGRLIAMTELFIALVGIERVVIVRCSY